MRIKAALYNADHLEYGLVTIPFPIPQDQYNDTIKMLEALDIGDPRAKDCMVEEIEGCVPSLKCLEGHRINVDELDYLVKRLDSFSDGELVQFQGMAAKMGLSDMTDLINLTFCCQQATVITDFSDLEQIGRDHYMNLHGGCVSTEELEELDSMETALLLISENEGTVTPYGVVYDNGMQLSRIYQGRNFPEYLYEESLMTVSLRSIHESDDSREAVWLYDNDKTTILNLPASDADIWRAVGEVDAASLDECAFRCIDCEIPSLRDAVDDAIEQESGIGMASEFATNLAQKKQSWHEADWVKYKALLSVAGHPHLQDAIQLMHGLDAYELRPDVAATWDYAELILREKYPDLPEELFQTGQAARVGQRMLEENHASITDYGLLRRKDSGQLPVFRKEQKEAPAWGGMEMA